MSYMKRKSSKKATPRQANKVSKVMKEYKEGTLKSGGSGRPVKKRKQAVAIALSEAGMSRKPRKRKK